MKCPKCSCRLSGKGKEVVGSTKCPGCGSTLDIYRLLAAEALHKSYDAVTDEDRIVVKNAARVAARMRAWYGIHGRPMPPRPGRPKGRRYDLSFMYTKRCNLACPFCMYSSGPAVNDALDIGKLRQWLPTVDMDLIASFGAYGGEVSINLREYSEIFNLLPAGKPRFCISNGAWSTDRDKTDEFIRWCADHRMFLVVSGTPEHRKYQDRAMLNAIKEAYPDAIRLKPEYEEFHPMGRLAGAFPVNCDVKCMWWKRALRVAVQPNGTIIFQNCDGVYPVVGSIDESFSTLDETVQRLRRNGFGSICPYYPNGDAK